MFQEDMNGMIKFGSRLISLFILITLVGCEEHDNVVSSKDLSNEQIYGAIRVYDRGQKDVYANVQLTVGGLARVGKSGDEYVELSKEDSLWVSSFEDPNAFEFGDDYFSELAQLSENLIQLPIKKFFLGIL